MEIPYWLSHKPIIGVDYSNQDAYAGDARFLSLGKSTWNEEDISAKIWRWAEEGCRWSRQSEEIPLWRVLDIAKLLIATIYGKQSSLGEEIVNPEGKDFLVSYLQENMELYNPRLQELKELLNSGIGKRGQHSNPNIFSFATSELSQDAIIAWLIGWADDSYLNIDRELCMLGKNFVSLLSDISVDDIHTITVDRQWKNIDVWAEINEDVFLTIEDKTGTSIHDDQLKRYKEIVEEEYRGKRNHLCFAYVKTENEPISILRDIEGQGYKTVDRRDILTILETYRGNNNLITDYREHLKNIEDETASYTFRKVNEWSSRNWQGFYKKLETYLDVDSWDYVANPNGGFLGLWWHFIENNEIRMYLQFEESKLCIKIEYEGEANRSDIRWKYFSKLMEKAKELELPVEKPSRFGAGTYMTIGVVPKEYIFGGEVIDFSVLIPKLKKLENLVDESVG